MLASMLLMQKGKRGAVQTDSGVVDGKPTLHECPKGSGETRINTYDSRCQGEHGCGRHVARVQPKLRWQDETDRVRKHRCCRERERQQQMHKLTLHSPQ